jgi:hypothetical protein
VEKYRRAVPDTDDIMAHTHFTLDTQGYKPTLGICDIAFPLQHVALCVSLLRYTQIVCLAVLLETVFDRSVLVI